MKAVECYLDGCDKPTQPKSLKDTLLKENPPQRVASLATAKTGRACKKIDYVFFLQVSWKLNPLTVTTF